VTARDALLAPVVLTCCVLAAVIAAPVLVVDSVVRLPDRLVNGALDAAWWLVEEVVPR
jgi:hypothetical protein